MTYTENDPGYRSVLENTPAYPVYWLHLTNANGDHKDIVITACAGVAVERNITDADVDDMVYGLQQSGWTVSNRVRYTHGSETQ